MSLTDEERRLQWHCRRGLKELDLFLSPFMERHYADLNAADKQRFIRLVSYEDMDLFNWFMGYTPAIDDEMENIIALIKEKLAVR